MPPLESELRQARYAKLNIARKTLGLDEDTYRDKLEALTGHRSARDCSIAQMDTVLDQFRKEGFKPTKGARSVSDKPHVRKVYAVWKVIVPFLQAQGDQAQRTALRTFVQRQTKSRVNPAGVSAPEFLNATEANKVIEALKDWRRRLEGDWA